MDITEIITTVLSFIVALLSAFVIPWLRAKIGNENLAEFLKWVDVAVAAAEQLYTSLDGEKKKAYVIDFLEDKGVSFTVEDVDAAVEAAVHRLHTELKGDAV